MGFLISPDVDVREINLTNTVPSVSTTEGAIGGVFHWGPVEQAVLVDSENTLVQRFGKPTTHNAETFFSAANFLSYSNKLYVSRGADLTETYNAVANTGAVGDVAAQAVKNADAYDAITFDSNAMYVARYPGAIGNSLRISVCDSNEAFESTSDLSDDTTYTTLASTIAADTHISWTVGSKTALVQMTVADASPTTDIDAYLATLSIGDYIKAGSSTIGYQYMKLSAISSVTIVDGATDQHQATLTFETAYSLSAALLQQSVTRLWEFYDAVDTAPGVSYHLDVNSLTAEDELHAVVVDEGGEFSGVVGSVLEVYESLSRATDAKTEEGASSYYKTAINNASSYIWWANDRAGAASALAAAVVSSTNVAPMNLRFNSAADGSDEGVVALSVLLRAYDVFANAEEIDISLVMQGKARGATAAGSGVSNDSNNYATLAQIGSALVL